MNKITYLGEDWLWSHSGAMKRGDLTYKRTAHGWWRVDGEIITDMEQIAHLDRIAIRAGIITNRNELLFYTVNARNINRIDVAAYLQKPKEASPNRDSLILIPPARLSLQLTWLSGLPAENSRTRQLGTLTVLGFVRQMMPEKDHVYIDMQIAYWNKLEVT